jgi:uncharacterized membrane protein YkvA (DUF1232 family)
MEAFDELLEKDVHGYTGPHSDIIIQAPQFFQLMEGILADEETPDRIKPFITAAISYFIAPVDIIPEAIHGPIGYIDDIFLCAFTADLVASVIGGTEVLRRNWMGQGDIVEFIARILASEKDLIGDKGGNIISYAGFDYLTKALQNKA